MAKSLGAKLPMPADWQLSEPMYSYARKYGMDRLTAEHEFTKCQVYHIESRFTAVGWERKVWQMWVLNWVSYGRKLFTPAEPTYKPVLPPVRPRTALEGISMPDEVKRLLRRVK